MKKIKIRIDNGKWLRADLIDGESKTNLCHAVLQLGGDIIPQYLWAIGYVRFYFPKLRGVPIETDNPEVAGA